MNPLLLSSEALGVLPDFASIRPEHVTPAIDELLAQADAALERAVSADVAPDYDALSMVLDVAVERLNTAWSHVNHLQSVVDSPALRAAHAENLPKLIDFGTRLSSDERLYAKYKAVAANQSHSLTPTRRKALADALRDFVLGGAELQGEPKSRYAEIQDRSGALEQQFSDHVLDATDAWSLVVTEDRLAGVPADVVQAAREAAQESGLEGCKLTLRAPCYLPLMNHARDRALRETLYRAYNTRASDFGPTELDNGPIVRELLELRQEEAQLLGYPSYADLSLVAKMAANPAQVLGFVRDLAQRARPHANRELAELRTFAAEQLGLKELEAWDRGFVAEELKQARYNFSSEDVKQYFTLPRVLQGLFGLVETLFEVAIREEPAPVWHGSVRFFRLWRGGEAVAGFYLDLQARAAKQSGAWMDSARSRWRRPGSTLQQPVAHLVCNFAPPVGDKPALLSHDDLITLFHEFGHGLHHLLTRVEDLAVSGISGVEDDAVELPSQFMENFCWEWEVVQRLSAHVDTGQPLPRELFDRMVSARHFLSGLGLLRQCEFSLFDMRVHTEPGASSQVQPLADEVCAEIQPVPAPPFYRYATSFSHLFAGGYAAGYYGYAWAQVLSADAYSAFEEAGVFDTATGKRFREQILEVGGSRPALESFRAFRGRDPQIDAMLRHQGLN